MEIQEHIDLKIRLAKDYAKKALTLRKRAMSLNETATVYEGWAKDCREAAGIMQQKLTPHTP